MTERLWLTEPRRRTALAVVVEVRRETFRLDRSLFAPKSHLYRHPQPADHGVVWLPGGEKRKLVGVHDEAGDLWHRLRDAVPRLGETLQCHLDPERRETIERAHLALHLLLHTVPRDLGALVADPEVRGGGHVRFAFDRPRVDAKLLAAWRLAALQIATKDLPLRRLHVPDTAVAHVLTPQPFAGGAPFPGPDTTREAVAIEGIGALPCDGTVAARTAAVGSLVVQEAHVDRAGHAVIVFRAGA